VISQGKQDKQPTARPLSHRAIVLGAVIVLGIGAAAFTVLLWRYGGLDAIRTASAITVAAGGAAALLLAARRQRSTEETLEHQRQTLEHQREVAQATERDAAEQRTTELYTRAVDQLGAEKAPVRLGGLHALERLAQNNPTQRQTIVDVICAYLRMPFTPPDGQAPGEDAPEDAHTRYEERKPKTAEVFWDDIDLDLTEAHLHEFDLSDCQVRTVRFDRTTFTGYAWFHKAEFTGYAWFADAKFTGDAWFGGAKFGGHAGFDDAKFAGAAVFAHAKFAGAAVFRGAKFAGAAVFRGAKFAGAAVFRGAKFAGAAEFRSAEFAGSTEFDGAHVAPSSHRVILPIGWTTRPAAEGEEEGWLYMVRDEDSSEQHAEAPGDGPA
jgi:hypothetical protein